jgi:hypothetical protein
MSEHISITIQISRATWETIQRATQELQSRAREGEMPGAVFDPYLHAAILLEQAVDRAEAERKRRTPGG